MTEATPQPAAQGNLSKTPFAHLVLYLYQHRSTGTLLLGESGATEIEPSSAIQILFQRGRAMAARFPSPVESIEDALLPWCAVAEAPFEFYQDDLVGSGQDVMVGMFDPYALVARSSRTHLRADVVRDLLARFGDAPLRIQSRADVDRLRLTPEESKLIEVLRAEPASIDTLCVQSELSPEATRALIYVLIVTRIVAPYEERVGPTFSTHIRTRDGEPLPRAPTSSAPPGARSTSPRVPAWQALASRMGVASSMRPPTATGTSSNSVKIVAGNSSRPSVPEAETSESSAKFKKIEQLCARAMFEDAWPLLRELVEAEPGNARYQGMLGFVALSRVSDNTVPKDVIDAVNAALRVNEDEVIALYTKALAYKRMGKDRESLHYFRRTVSVEPGHIDAAREIRLFGLRQSDEKKSKR